MFRVFNAFQVTLLFSCLPFIIGWLRTNPFDYAGALVWVAIVAYVVLFITTIIGYCELTEKL